VAQDVYLAIAYTPIAMLLVRFAPHLFPLLGITETARARQGIPPAPEFERLPLLIYVAFRRYLQGSAKYAR
jgi:hypothetical protein